MHRARRAVLCALSSIARQGHLRGGLVRVARNAAAVLYCCCSGVHHVWRAMLCALRACACGWVGGGGGGHGPDPVTAAAVAAAAACVCVVCDDSGVRQASGCAVFCVCVCMCVCV